MSIDWIIIATIGGPILGAAIGVWLDQKFENRPKLIVYYGHISEFDVNSASGTPLKVHTHSIIIRNAGRRSAKNVRIGHFIAGVDFKILPPTPHSVSLLAGGGNEIIIPNLVPKKQITISYLYYPPLTWNQINAYVESDEGAAKAIQVILTPQIPGWLKKVLWFLILIGSISLIYLAYDSTKLAIDVIQHYNTVIEGTKK